MDVLIIFQCRYVNRAITEETDFRRILKKVESEINSWNTVASCQAELIKACRGSVFVSRVELECKPQSAAATCFCLFQLRAACLMGRTSKTRPTSETDCFWFFYHFSCFLFHFFFLRSLSPQLRGTWKPCDPG